MRLKRKLIILLARSTCVLQTCVREILEIHHIILKRHHVVLQISADRHYWTKTHVESPLVCTGPLVIGHSCCSVMLRATITSSSLLPGVICPKRSLSCRFRDCLRKQRQEDIISSSCERVSERGGVSVSSCAAVTTAREWDYKPWITHRGTQKHKSTTGFGPGSAFDTLWP